MGARMEEYESDTIIFSEGSRCERMYIVLEGQVVLYQDYGDENEYVIGACGKGKTFGEMNLFTESPCFYTAVAFTKVKLAWFEKKNLDSFVKGYPESTMGLLENIAKSYVLIGKNLQMAIAEINSLHEQLNITGMHKAFGSTADDFTKGLATSNTPLADENPRVADAPKSAVLSSSPLLSGDDFTESLKNSGSYHFIGRNNW